MMDQTDRERVISGAQTVSSITFRIRTILANDSGLQFVWLRGEVSNCTKHSSGHIYFTLKDENAQISCSFFKNYHQKGMKVPAQGDQILVMGSVEVYPPRGNYQFIVTELHQSGEGDLHKKFLMLKEKLEAEGLFRAENKRMLPTWPNTIGIITSPTGAVLWDIYQTIKRRFPFVKLLLSPAKVQGEDASDALISALELIQNIGTCDLVIIARGGGSFEDLWCFNDERLVRKIAGFPIPVVSAIGHETDFTLTDFAADIRAATPTAAAEMCVPDRNALLEKINSYGRSISNSIQYFTRFHHQKLDDLTSKMESALMRKSEKITWELNRIEELIDSFDYRKTLQRGFALVKMNGKVVTKAKNASPGNVEILLQDGVLTGKIETINYEEGK